MHKDVRIVKLTHLRVAENLPQVVADLTFLGVPHEYPVHLVRAEGVGPAAQVPTGCPKVCPALLMLTTRL